MGSFEKFQFGVTGILQFNLGTRFGCVKCSGKALNVNHELLYPLLHEEIKQGCPSGQCIADCAMVAPMAHSNLQISPRSYLPTWN
jgi:hypothetical protein